MEVAIAIHNSFEELMNMSMYRFLVTRKTAATVFEYIHNPEEDVRVVTE